MKLLRVLQEQEFERVGGTQTVRVDARVIAATNRDLAADVQRRTFRADLFFRLNIFPIRVPSLHERRDDIPILARHFVREFASRMARSIDRIVLARSIGSSPMTGPGMCASWRTSSSVRSSFARIVSCTSHTSGCPCPRRRPQTFSDS